MAKLAFPLASPIGGDLLHPEVRAADMHAADLVLIEFTEYMKNDSNLTNPANYAITGGSFEVTVSKVITSSNRPAVFQAFLVVSPSTIGTTYTVTVTTKVASAGGTPLSSTKNVAKFISRRTKTDNILDSIPRTYDKDPTDKTGIRAVLLGAIGRADDYIGGTKNDSLPKVTDGT